MSGEDDYVYDEATGEWRPASEVAAAAAAAEATKRVVRDSAGNALADGDSVTLIKESTKLTDAATGNGPVDAVFNGIERIVGQPGILRDYDLKAVTMGKDALGEAMVRVEIAGTVYSGIGTSPDVIEASARAYLNAFNRFFANSH